VRQPEHQRGERGLPHGTVNKQAGLEKTGAAADTQQPGVGKLVKVTEGGKFHRREGKTTSHMGCK
jgi:hypothetical protein